MSKSNVNQHQKKLTLLFVTWFLYSAGMLGFMILEDKTPPHCVNLENNG